jgi:hypothetical protein
MNAGYCKSRWDVKEIPAVKMEHENPKSKKEKQW